ncbi:pol protein [Gossypium australe]|uniref:Pol protein n=1 Tax=Gossypium australe TaxID=47621 RepID=A0A5B6V1T2_9ROSI|nr:pol protein [Gossypium australe]
MLTEALILTQPESGKEFVVLSNTSLNEPAGKDIEFEICNKVFLKVLPLKKVLRFDRKGKLSPRFIGPYEILERIGLVAYRLALPLELDQIHNVFHVLMLRRYRFDPSHVLTIGKNSV